MAISISSRPNAKGREGRTPPSAVCSPPVISDEHRSSKTFCVVCKTALFRIYLPPYVGLFRIVLVLFVPSVVKLTNSEKLDLPLRRQDCLVAEGPASVVLSGGFALCCLQVALQWTSASIFEEFAAKMSFGSQLFVFGQIFVRVCACAAACCLVIKARACANKDAFRVLLSGPKLTSTKYFKSSLFLARGI